MKRLLLLAAVLMALFSCTALLGPVDIEDTAGTSGEIDRWLQQALELYLGATGDEAETKLESAKTIYENILARSDASDAQKAEAARGFSRTYLELEIDNPGDIMESFYQFFTSFSAVEFTADTGVAQFTNFNVNIADTIDVVLSNAYYQIPVSERTEEDMSYMALLNAFAIGEEMANFFTETASFSEDLLAFESNFPARMTNLTTYADDYQTAIINLGIAITNFPPDPDAVNDYLTNMETASNNIVATTNVIATDIDNLLQFTNIVYDFSSKLFTRISKLSNETASASNIINITVNSNLGRITEVLDPLTSAFDELDDETSLLNEPFQLPTNM